LKSHKDLATSSNECDRTIFSSQWGKWFKAQQQEWKNKEEQGLLVVSKIKKYLKVLEDPANRSDACRLSAEFDVEIKLY